MTNVTELESCGCCDREIEGSGIHDLNQNAVPRKELPGGLCVAALNQPLISYVIVRPSLT
jgi:hypothetical protein